MVVSSRIYLSRMVHICQEHAFEMWAMYFRVGPVNLCFLDLVSTHLIVLSLVVGWMDNDVNILKTTAGAAEKNDIPLFILYW